MPVAFEIGSHQIDIARTVEDVFRTMLCMDVGPSHGTGAEALGSLTAAVHFVGEWKGAVLLQCSPEQAFVFTSLLMPGYRPTRLDEDTRDALGELANMIGGNLKSVLPGGVALSMPSVVEGSDYALHICGGNASQTLNFNSEVGVFGVTLVQVVEKDG
jgi:chemotaxis protein CheX